MASRTGILLAFAAAGVSSGASASDFVVRTATTDRAIMNRAKFARSLTF